MNTNYILTLYNVCRVENSSMLIIHTFGYPHEEDAKSVMCGVRVAINGSVSKRTHLLQGSSYEDSSSPCPHTPTNLSSHNITTHAAQEPQAITCFDPSPFLILLLLLILSQRASWSRAKIAEHSQLLHTAHPFTQPRSCRRFLARKASILLHFLEGALC
jgi:hypothetical protein